MRRRGIIVSALIAIAVLSAFLFWRSEIVPYRERFSLYFQSNVHGLTVGAPVKMLGQDVGQVVEINIVSVPPSDARAREFFAEVVVSIDSKAIARHGGIPPKEFFRNQLDAFTERGMRGRLMMPSLLAAGLCVDLFFDAKTPAEFVNPPSGKYPEIPTKFTSSSDFINRANTFIKARNLLEISQKIENARRAVGKIEAFANDFDALAFNAKTLAQLERANAAVDPEKIRRELADATREISAVRTGVVETGEIHREHAEKLVARLKNFSASLREIRETATAARMLAAPEKFEPTRRDFQELQNRLAPFIETGKALFF